jgi:hypothetical protein
MKFWLGPVFGTDESVPFRKRRDRPLPTHGEFQIADSRFQNGKTIRGIADTSRRASGAAACELGSTARLF